MRARRWDVGLNIDAEESERLDLSLDLLEALCREPGLRGWNGVGFVVQAYQKRAYPVLGWIIELARATKRRIMLRLVKGAYWDSEIKRAQVEGLEGFAVFTRKVHTDVSYIACAKLLLAAPDAVFPQFATHNALTVATIHAMAGGNFYAGQYEFQCLHGMGEPLYSQIVDSERGHRPCRIYAPVGSHDTLLAYLVRRLLENGANTSFVNRIADPNVPVEALLEDPVEAARALSPVGAPHPRIALPRDLFGRERANSAGLDLSNEARLAELGEALVADAAADPPVGARAIVNPADRRDIVGWIVDADPAEVEEVCASALRAWPEWRGRAPARARGHSRPGRSAVRSERAASRRADLSGSRQDAAQRARRRARGGRLPALLRRADRVRLPQRDASPARARRLHQPLEFPDRDLHRSARRRARRRQRRRRQARRGDAADRGRGRAADARGGRSRRRAAAAARRRRGRRARSPRTPMSRA